MLSIGLAWSADGERFTADIAGGGQLKFEVISEEEKTCMVYQYADVKTPDDGAIVVPEMVNGYTVVRLYYNAFYQGSYEDCKITSITLPNTIREIDDKAFFRTRITKITIPEGVTTLGGSAFCDCAALESVSLPSTLVSPVAYATFMGCTSLESVDLPDGITEIEHSAFWGCTNLKSVHLPNSLTKIWRDAFYNCSSLEGLELPEGFVSIEASALSGCSSLTHVTIPSTATDIEWGTFWSEKLPALKTVKLNTPTVIDYFYQSKTLEYVELGPAVRVIDGEAFRGCAGLKSINLHEGLTSIGTGAFNYCSSLESIELPHSAFIHRSAFGDCNSLRQVIVHQDTLKAWFSRLESLETVVLGDEVKYIEKGTLSSDGVFSNCTSLKNVTLSTNITKIADYMFYRCTSLTHLTLLEKVDSIGNSAFYDCTALEGITLSDNLESISSEAFYRCTNLESIILPAKVNTIGYSAFSNCDNLKRVYSQIVKPFAYGTWAFPWDNAVLIVPQGMKADYKSVSGWSDAVIFEEGETAYDKKQTDEQGIKYTLNQNGTDYSVYYSVTGHAEALPTAITIPATLGDCPVTTVAYGAFTDCTNLEQVTFADGLTNIDFYAFNGCISLKTFVSQIKAPSKVSISTSTETTNRAVLWVPTGTKAAYLNTSWKNFFIFEEGETQVNYDRTVTDEQGVKYELKQDATSFYYIVTGHTDQLLSEIVIPNKLNGLTVRELRGYDIFKNCENLTKVTFPEGMTYIDFGAFTGCTNLTTFVSKVADPSAVEGSLPTEVYQRAVLWVPAGTREAYRKTFMGNFFVYEEGEADVAYERNITDEQGVSYQLDQDSDGFKYSVVGHTDALAERVTIPETVNGVPVKSITGLAFENSSGMKWLSIPETVTSIDKYSAFTGCSFTLALNQKVISYDSWSHSSFITALELGNKVDSIAREAFSYCSNLSEVSFGENVRVISNGVFANCYSLKSVTLPKNVVMHDVSSSSYSPFNGCSAIEEITIECNRFGNWFSGIKSLKTVNIGSGVKEVSSSALRDCTGVETIVVDAANTIFDSRDNCNAIIETATNKLLAGCNTTQIPESINAIGEYAFYGMEGLTEVSIPAGVTAIGNYAFSGCSNLQTAVSYLKTPFSISAFDDNARTSATLRVPFGRTNRYKQTSGWEFQNIEEMEGEGDDINFILFADANTKAACVAKYDENGDGEVSISEAKQVTEFSVSSKPEAVSFNELKYFENVTTLSNSAFSGWKKLTTITLPANLQTIGSSAFANCESLVNINVPKSVTEVGSYAFKGCSSLSDIELPEGLTTIGEYAFSGSGLTKLTIPSTVNSVGNYSITGYVITCLPETPPSVDGNKSIHSYPQDAVLRVPAGCEDAYRNATGWKDFMIISTSAADTDWADGQLTVTLDEAGGLRLALIELDDEEITRLKIVGPMNSTDLKYLTEGKGKIANLESLDLSDVTLVYGGDAYAQKKIVYDDVWPIRTDITEYYLSEEEQLILPGDHVPGIGNYSTTTRCYGPYLAGAFMEKSYKHVVMPRGVTKAAYDTFYKCEQLVAVEFPGGMGDVGNEAFSGCIRLQSINLELTDSVGDDAFSSCKMLSSLGRTERLKYVGNKAFYGCTHLMDTDGTLILTQVDSIPEQAFYDCVMVGDISLSSNLRYVGESAFYGCKSLKAIRLPESIEVVATSAFSGCTALQEVSLPTASDIITLDYTCFENTPWMNNLPVEDGIKYAGTIALNYDTPSAVAATSPATLTFREGTTYVADRFAASIYYSHRPNITKLSLPASLRRIGEEAFLSQKYNSPLSLGSLTLPDGLEVIGQLAFANNTELTKVTLPKNLKVLGNEAFKECTGIALVNYNTVEAIGNNLFSGCSSIEKVNVGALVRCLPDGIFNECSALTVVKFAEREIDTPLTIGNSAFSDCINLLSITLPSSTTSIGDETFRGCTALTNFIVPENVTTLGSNAFASCSGLTTLTLPDGLRTIGDNAFYNCTALMSVELPVLLDSLGSGAFSDCYALTEMTLPAAITRLGDNVMGSCYQLTKLTSLMARPLPVSDVISMGNSVLYEKLGIYSNFSEYSDIRYNEVILYVPDGSKALYRLADGWKKFEHIEELGDNDVTARNRVITDAVTVAPGQTAPLAIALQNDIEDFTAYQFDIIMPLGLTLATNVDGDILVSLSDRYSDSQQTIRVERLTVHQYADYVKYRVMCLSQGNKTIIGNSGNLLTLTMVAATGKSEGNYAAKIENVIFTQTDGSKHVLDNCSFDIIVRQQGEMLMGDTNGDGSIDVADVVAVVNYILDKPAASFVSEAADLNEDGSIDVADVVKLVSMVLKQNPASAPQMRAYLRRSGFIVSE